MKTQKNNNSCLNFPEICAYAGLQYADKPGLSVEACAQRLARLAAIKKSCVRIYAAHMTGTPEWEFKASLGRWMWEEATDFQALEQRITELRSPKAAIDKVLDYQLGDLMTEILHSPDSTALATGLFEVLKPALSKAIRKYLDETQSLVDQPTVRLLKTMLAEEQERLAVGCEFAAVFSKNHSKAMADWKKHFESFLAAAGGILGENPVPTIKPKPRASEEYRISREFRRDDRFKTTIPKTVDPKVNKEKLPRMMWVRAQEMTAAEMMASVVYEWDDLPTEGMVDLARHCWDEVRHSLMGCAALQAEGKPIETFTSWVGYAGHTMNVPPQKRYSHLAIATEAGAMAYPGGKRGEWEFCRDEAKHPLMTTFQDFDWADEVTHVNYGRKWLVEYYLKGDRQKAKDMADETMEERKKFYAQFGQDGAIKLGTGY